ncbi:MAG: hypothetical protein JWQ09_500 [Segetibacter sp.]|nr:hypothetical protein [Segetibacter sp.]
MSSKEELKKFLNRLGKEELIKEVEKLYSKFPQVKTCYDVELSGDTSLLLSEAKRKIENEYFPSKGLPKARSGEIKKIIDGFAKVSVYPKDVIDLYLFRFEMAVRFTKTYGDIDEPFYNAAENAFKKTLLLIQKHGYKEELKEKVKELVKYSDGLGWGFSDVIKDFYYTYMGD